MKVRVVGICAGEATRTAAIIVEAEVPASSALHTLDDICQRYSRLDNFLGFVAIYGSRLDDTILSQWLQNSRLDDLYRHCDVVQGVVHCPFCL